MNLRPPTLDDLPALGEFFHSLEESGGQWASEEELRDWLTNPRFDVESDFRVALADGRIVGWCDLWDQNRAHQRLFLDLRPHPAFPQTYAMLLDWGVERAFALACEGGFVRVWGDSRDELFAREVRGRGFQPVRHFFRMEIDLEREPAQPIWPEGICIRTFRPGEARAVYDAFTDAFADHWDFVPSNFEDWEQNFVHASYVDPALWFIADEGGEIAGFSLCRSERRPGIGHVGVLGVRPPWRRRGLGLALLLHSFHELRARGRTKADLGVDAENTTGAVRLYERAGMHTVRRMDSYEKVLT